MFQRVWLTILGGVSFFYLIDVMIYYCYSKIKKEKDRASRDLHAQKIDIKTKLIVSSGIK